MADVTQTRTGIAFMSSAPSLSGTIFTDDDLRNARLVWAHLEQRCAPGWFAKPRGLLAGLFEANTPHAACVLIEIAAALDAVRLNLTVKSVPVFEKKVVSLLTAKEEKVFDELLTEILVAATLTGSVSPISFEPYVPAGVGGQRPTSSDYAIWLPDGPVAIEVSVLYIGQLERWQRRVREIRDIVREKIGAAEGVYRDVELELPLEFSPKLGAKLSERRVTNEIIRAAQGELEFPVGRQTARLRWRPMPIYEQTTFDVSNVPAETNTWVVADGGPGAAKNSFGFTSRPTGDPKQFTELMFSSLKNTLARKRDQFRGKKERYVLILKLGHHRMPPELLHDLFRARIWPNKSLYHWITCFAEFRPRRQYTQGGQGPSLSTQVNPNGAPQAGPQLSALLNGEKTFHAPRAAKGPTPASDAGATARAE
jgi:hypothetical protein